MSEKTAKMLLKRFPKLKVSFDAGETMVGTDEKTNKRVIDKINDFAPRYFVCSIQPDKARKVVIQTS